jgi:hypothetical protein
VVLVVLSLGASLGSLLLLVTTRFGATLIGADGPRDIHPIAPITIVAITVALSTDYEVILISRIAEHYRRTGDNRSAVVSGIEHTGSVITSAAAIMVAVFAGFALADLLPVKQLGVGLSLAVILDATVVRGVLVPAAMAVMGRGNWWWPRMALPQGAALSQEIAMSAVPAEVTVLAPPQEIATAAPPLGRAAFARELAAIADENSVSRHDEQRAGGASGDHAHTVPGAASTPADGPEQDQSGTGRIHHAADVKQTVVLERPWWLPAALRRLGACRWAPRPRVRAAGAFRGRSGKSRNSPRAAMVSAMLRAQISALDPRVILAVGAAANVLAARLPGVRVVTNPAMLPATRAPAPLGHMALLVHMIRNEHELDSRVEESYVEDHPIMSPQQTITRAPRLSMISYQ